MSKLKNILPSYPSYTQIQVPDGQVVFCLSDYFTDASTAVANAEIHFANTEIYELNLGIQFAKRGNKPKNIPLIPLIPHPILGAG